MITIGIAEDHETIRKTIALIFSRIKNCSVILTAENGFELIDSLQKSKTLPSIVFLDVQMPLLDGVSTAYYIRTHFPKIQIVAASNYSHHLVAQDMFDAGASAYVLKKNISESSLEGIISSVLNGIPFIDPDIELGNLIALPEKVSYSKTSNAEINKKENTFLQLFATNISVEQIAQLMYVAPKSIYNYQKSLKLKLGLCSRQELTIYALQHDIARIARYKTLTALQTKSSYDF